MMYRVGESSIDKYTYIKYKSNIYDLLLSIIELDPV